MANLYYYQPAGVALPAFAIKNTVGIDPAKTGIVGLNAAGVYPVTKVTQPFNTAIFNVALTYTINGTNADETWTATSITPLANSKPNAIKQLISSSTGQTVNLIQASGLSFRLFVSIASQLVGDRPARFAPWFVRRQANSDALGTNITAVDGASTANAINDIVSPAWGCIDIAYDSANPNNLLASDFTTDEFFSKNLAAADFELYFPQTTTTVSYSGGFAATTNAFTDLDKTVQIRRASNSLVVDEFEVPAGTSVIKVPFGYRKYQGVELGSSSY